MKVLETLKVYLDNLPTQLPLVDSSISCYASFLSFSLDPNILDHTGCEVTTLGEQLEGIFGWKARTSGDGVLPILERGAAICALVDMIQIGQWYGKHNVRWLLNLSPSCAIQLGRWLTHSYRVQLIKSRGIDLSSNSGILRILFSIRFN